jgi:hypothetical protein
MTMLLQLSSPGTRFAGVDYPSIALVDLGPSRISNIHTVLSLLCRSAQEHLLHDSLVTMSILLPLYIYPTAGAWDPLYAASVFRIGELILFTKSS